MMKIWKRSELSLVGLKRTKYLKIESNLDASLAIQVVLLVISVQNECVAGIVDTVQRGLGMLHQQAIFRELVPEGHRENE